MKELNRTKRLSIAAVIFIAILSIGILTRYTPPHSYKIDPDEMAEAAMMLEDEIFPDEVYNIIEYEDSGYFFIDIRIPDEFAKGHLAPAVNVPIHDFLEKESIELFDDLAEDSVTVVMYGETQTDANGAWFLLKQLGYNNIKVMLGGYEYYTTGPLDIYDMPDIPEFLVEEPAVDYLDVMDELAGGMYVADEATDAPEIVVPKRKKKKAAAEGGC